MALTKVTYVDGSTVIRAANLNAIQDEIIANAGSIAALDTDKVDKVQGKGLSENDFTTVLKTKLDGIAEGATNVTVDGSLDTSSSNAIRNSVVATKFNAIDAALANVATDAQIDAIFA